MRLNAAIALQGLTTSEYQADEVIERIRYLLHDLEPTADVGIELLSVGTDFGGPLVLPSPMDDLVALAERRRDDLLQQFWSRHERALLIQSLRLGHALLSMNLTRIRRVMSEIDDVFC